MEKANIVSICTALCATPIILYFGKKICDTFFVSQLNNQSLELLHEINDIRFHHLESKIDVLHLNVMTLNDTLAETITNVSSENPIDPQGSVINSKQPTSLVNTMQGNQDVLASNLSSEIQENKDVLTSNLTHESNTICDFFQQKKQILCDVIPDLDVGNAITPNIKNALLASGNFDIETALAVSDFAELAIKSYSIT